MGPKPRRVVRLACQAAARPRDGHAFPRGPALPRNAQTGFSWHGAAALCSPVCKKPARENAIHPLAQAKGLSGGEAVNGQGAARIGGDARIYHEIKYHAGDEEEQTNDDTGASQGKVVLRRSKGRSSLLCVHVHCPLSLNCLRDVLRLTLVCREPPIVAPPGTRLRGASDSRIRELA